MYALFALLSHEITNHSLDDIVWRFWKSISTIQLADVTSGLYIGYYCLRILEFKNLVLFIRFADVTSGLAI
ncbi:hypothetical protein DPMN_155342 [Dreissena polymorpha]|uniref:Uncharacterized protein n=1 Tax=Dreissena polymorpha TaxID=45954 RepID=A0A9D4FMP9_DREPO|nr:hypothetical protein DPMN_155342 [Dreissena polymorpha]